jgi:hypothetical protein
LQISPLQLPRHPALCQESWTRHDVSLSVWADQSRFPAAEVEDFLFAVERLLVAAERRNVPARDISDLTGRPVLRDASWRWIDSCWVELPAVQRLLDDVAASLPGIDAAQVFYARDIASTQKAESLVAYVSAADDKITPEILHAQCGSGWSTAPLRRRPPGTSFATGPRTTWLGRGRGALWPPGSRAPVGRELLVASILLRGNRR